MSEEEKRTSRRNFLKKGAFFGTAAFLTGFGLQSLRINAENIDPDKKAILMDHSICVECQACRLACQNENDFPYTIQSIKFKNQETGTYPDVDYHISRWSCFHCSSAPCVEICPVDAIYSTEQGMNTTDIEKCVGCHQCVGACPYEVPQMQDDKMYKCNGCVHLLEQDESPACVSTCPTYALDFGSQQEMAEKGADRVEELQLKDEEAYLYGLEAQEGLGLLMVLRTSPDKFQLI